MRDEDRKKAGTDQEDCDVCFGAPGESPTGTLNQDGSRLGWGGEGGGGGGHYSNNTAEPPVLPHIGGEPAVLREDGQRREGPAIDVGGAGPNDYGLDDALTGDPDGPN
jgi:hypothetical protein